jgi:hypothetical protein
MTLVLDAAPIGTGLELFAGAAFLLTFAGIAFIVFKLLKKTVKMAVRMAIAGVILAIAIIGGVYLLFSGSSKTTRPPARTTPAR